MAKIICNIFQGRPELSGHLPYYPLLGSLNAFLLLASILAPH